MRCTHPCLVVALQPFLVVFPHSKTGNNLDFQPSTLFDICSLGLTTHRVRDAEGVAGGGCPPHHQVGEAGDPEDAPQEGDRKQLPSWKDIRDNVIRFLIAYQMS